MLTSAEAHKSSTLFIPSDMELCSSAIFACSELLNSSNIVDATQLPEAWDKCKQQIIRDLLILWTGENNPTTQLKVVTSKFIDSDFETATTEYSALLQSAKKHFGDEKSPLLFRSTELSIDADKIGNYLHSITSLKGKKISFAESHSIRFLQFTMKFLITRRGS